jgi:hypothetical protein
MDSQRRTQVVLKSAILLSYAHVEGAVKAALTVLFTRLNSSGLTWAGVRSKLSHFEIDHRLARQVNAGHRRAMICGDDTTLFLRSILQQRIQFDIPGLVDQIGVMNAQTLRKILETCGFALATYESDLGLLDDRLIAHRHQLAHGSLVPVDQLTAETAIALALSLLNTMLVDFSNLLVLESYRVSAA